jgi:imidazolonepropionase-like amidohydrolase
MRNIYVVFGRQKISGVAVSKKGDLLGEFDVITPALIDPHSHIGMQRAGEPHDQSEANERLDSFLALPDALDSVQMDDLAFRDAIEMGVLY